MNIERVNAELQRTLSLLIQNETKDPRVLEGMVSVTQVETTQDLKYAKVFVSILHVEDENAVLKVLQNSAKRYKAELFKRLRIRAVPDLTFLLDNSAKHQQHIEEILKTLNISPATDDEETN